LAFYVRIKFFGCIFEAWLIWFIYFNIKNHVFYISPKSIGNKSRLPWVNNQLKKLINKKNKLYKKKKGNPKYKEQYQKTKTKPQNEMRNSYWRYIENMIFDIEINEPDLPSFKNTAKKL
jgi:hypothetical protein